MRQFIKRILKQAALGVTLLYNLLQNPPSPRTGYKSSNKKLSEIRTRVQRSPPPPHRSLFSSHLWQRWQKRMAEIPAKKCSSASPELRRTDVCGSLCVSVCVCACVRACVCVCVYTHTIALENSRAVRRYQLTTTHHVVRGTARRTKYTFTNN